MNYLRTKEMKKLLVIISMLPSLTFANTDSIATPFPGATKGINIWSVDKLDSSTKEISIKHLKASRQNGYNKTSATDESFNSLYNIRKVAENEIKEYDISQNPLDTHLRSDISKLKLSFDFSGIPGISKENVIGFSPAGGYSHQNGWDGVVEFAQIPNIGICSFTTFSIQSVVLYKEALEYLVNKKPTDKNISGNWNTGFIYKINWYTDTRRNSLECANKSLDHELMNKILLLANQIDNNLSSKN